MAFKIVWTEQAREDLRDIVQFIALDNPTIAESFGFTLISKTDNLSKFPFFGRVVPEIGKPSIREIIVSPYRLVYEVIEVEQTIAVIRVWHAARGKPEL